VSVNEWTVKSQHCKIKIPFPKSKRFYQVLPRRQNFNTVAMTMFDVPKGQSGGSFGTSSGRFYSKLE